MHYTLTSATFHFWDYDTQSYACHDSFMGVVYDGQHTATHCNTLQHTATHCNTLQHTATQMTQSYACHDSFMGVVYESVM